MQLFSKLKKNLIFEQMELKIPLIFQIVFRAFEENRGKLCRRNKDSRVRKGLLWSIFLVINW